MKSIAKILLLCFSFFLATTPVFAQESPTSSNVGLRASIQSGQTNLQVPIWIANNVTVAPILGINHQENAFTAINVGIAPRFYQNLGNDFASYIGARGILQRTSPDTGPDDTDFLIGATGGGEYFVDDHFSMGVQGQLNFSLNDGGNNGITTGAAVSGTYYF